MLMPAYLRAFQVLQVPRTPSNYTFACVAASLGTVLSAINSSFFNFPESLAFVKGRGWQDDGTPACLPWAGLSCDAAGHVTAVNFSGWNLQGEQDCLYLSMCTQKP